MAKALSMVFSKTTTLAIVPSFSLAGVAAMMFDYSVWAWVLWGIAGMWLVFFIVFKPQHIYIEDIECTYPANLNYANDKTILVEGHISARHPEQLEECYLILERGEVKSLTDSDLPDEIGNVSYKFRAYFPIKSSALEEGDMGIICVRVKSGLWYNPPFLITCKKTENGDTAK